MSSKSEVPGTADSLEWKPLLFVRYRDGKKMRTADLRGPEWPEPLNPSIASLVFGHARLWKETAIDLAFRDGVPEWVRVVRQYGDETGTAFVPWSDVLAFEYQGDVLPDDARSLPSPP